MHDGWPHLDVFLLADPRPLEGGDGGKDGAADPGGATTLTCVAEPVAATGQESSVSASGCVVPVSDTAAVHYTPEHGSGRRTAPTTAAAYSKVAPQVKSFAWLLIAPRHNT